MGANDSLKHNLEAMKGANVAVDAIGDLPYKEDFVNNSFFAIGHFEAEGHVIDYLYHLMSYAYPGHPCMTSCLSVTDETTGEYYQDSLVVPLDDFEKPGDRFMLKHGRDFMESDGDTMTLKAAFDKGAIDLELKLAGYPLYNGTTGQFHMVGMDISEYSIPTCPTTGTIRIADKTYEVEGRSWYDRQWQQGMPKHPKFAERFVDAVVNHLPKMGGGLELPVWGWMDINLDNGDFVSTWFAREDDGEYCWATLMHPDGTQRTVALEPVVARASDRWTSPDSGAIYPMTYQITAPDIELDVTVRSVPAGQELYFPDDPMMNHYEGASQVEGTYRGEPVRGYCYVELIGDWSK